MKMMSFKIYGNARATGADKPLYLLKVLGDDRHITMTPMGGGTPLSLSYVFGDKGAEMQAALELAESVEEAKEMLEALVPHYLSGPFAPEPVYTFEVWNPRELLKGGKK